MDQALYCTRCDKDLPRSARFCTRCGSDALEKRPTPAVETQGRLEENGASGRAEICAPVSPHGDPVEIECDEGSTFSVRVRPRGPQSKAGLAVGIVIVLAIVIGVIAMNSSFDNEFEKNRQEILDRGKQIDRDIVQMERDFKKRWQETPLGFGAPRNDVEIVFPEDSKLSPEQQKSIGETVRSAMKSDPSRTATGWKPYIPQSQPFQRAIER